MTRPHDQKLWLALAAEVLREISIVEWTMGTGVVSAFVIMTLRLFSSV